MSNKKEYAVIRFLEQGNSFYQVSDIVKGMSIIQMVKEKKILTSKKVAYIFEGVLLQLQKLYKMQEEPYGYVNPCAIIFSENEQIYFADTLSKDNLELMNRMKKKSFREKFMSEDAVREEKVRKKDDLYGVGKVIQFILDRGNLEENFSKIEKNQFQRLIKKCLVCEGTEEELLEALLEELRNYGKKNFFKYKNEMINLILCGSICIVIGGVLFQPKEKDVPEPQVVEKIEEEKVSDEKIQLYLELALLYYAEESDYLEMRSVLEKVRKESKLAKIYLELLDYLQNGGEISEEQWNQYWEVCVKEWTYWNVLADIKYKLPLLEACKISNTTKSWQIVKQIGEQFEKETLWENEKEETIVRFYLGEAYTVLGEKEAAILQYERLKNIVEELSNLEKVYLKLLFLYSKDLQQEEGKNKMEQLISEVEKRIPNIIDNPELKKWKEYCVNKESVADELGE